MDGWTNYIWQKKLTRMDGWRFVFGKKDNCLKKQKE
jgi:hypothetical protein